MKLKLALIFSAAVATLSAQSLTPNTTLCASLNGSANTVCLSAVSGTSPNWTLANQYGLYIDGEYMVVNGSNSTTYSGTNQYVPVSRGTRGGLGAPTPHANGAVVWVAIFPNGASGTQPGVNGFGFGTNLKNIGTCNRGSFTYLPIILPDLNQIKDCPVPNNGTTGEFSDFYGYANANYTQNPVQLITASSAITPTSGVYVITKSSAAAVLTLNAPVAGVQDGAIIIVVSSTTQAHTITSTGNLGTGSASVNTATFAAFAGSSIKLIAYGGKWLVLSSVGVTFS